MRINFLENEVALYRQAAGIQSNPVLTDIPSVNFTKKRKLDDLSKFLIVF